MKKGIVVVVFVVFALLGMTPATRAASDFECPPTIAGTINGNLVVPPGAFCVFGPGTVMGNVIALKDSNVVLRDVTVWGNVEAYGADALWITNLLSGAAPNVVRGNIHLVEGGPSAIFTNEVVICNTKVEHGNIQIEKREGSILVGHVAACANSIERGGIKVEDNHIPAPIDYMSISYSTMAWNLQVFKNVGPGYKFVQFNTHYGALQCKENAPSALPAAALPFFGGPNNGPGDDDPGDQCFDTTL